MSSVSNIDIHVFETREGCFAARFSWTENGKQKHWNSDMNNVTIESLVIDLYAGLGSILSRGLITNALLALTFRNRATDSNESVN